MKKQLIIAALLLALAVLAFMLLYTVTVYPAFQKSVGSIDTLRQALRSDAILYPAVEDLLQEPNYTLSLDGRTVFAKPVGYVIDGTEPYADTEIYYLFTGSTTPCGASYGAGGACRGGSCTGKKTAGDWNDGRSGADFKGSRMPERDHGKSDRKNCFLHELPY